MTGRGFDCARCRQGRIESAARGREWVRCFHPEALRGPGRVVTPPLANGAVFKKVGVEAPEWCPRRSSSRFASGSKYSPSGAGSAPPLPIGQRPDGGPK